MRAAILTGLLVACITRFVLKGVYPDVALFAFGHLRVSAYYGLLAAAAVFALLRGGRPERQVAWTLLAMLAADRLVRLFVARDFDAFDAIQFAIDLAGWLALLAIALRADRRWPLWVSAFQSISLLAHGVRALDVSVHPAVYLIMQVASSWPILIALICGTAAHSRRLRATRASPSWNGSSPARGRPTRGASPPG